MATPDRFRRPMATPGRFRRPMATPGRFRRPIIVGTVLGTVGRGRGQVQRYQGCRGVTRGSGELSGECEGEGVSHGQ